MSWMIPDNRLDDDQRQVKDIPLRNQQSTLIQGPAGSGKSVILVNILQNILDKHANKKICMVLFTHSLIDMMRAGIPDQFSSKIQIFTAYDFDKNHSRSEWDFIIIDEVQDINDRLLDKIFRCTKQVILAGDSAQSIYENGCTMDYFDNIQNLQKPKLKKIYRLPKSIQRIAYHFADNAEDFISYQVHQNVANVSVQLKKYPNHHLEAQEVWLKAREFAWQGLPSVVIFPKNDDLVNFCNTVLVQENKSSWEATYNYYGRRSSINYEGLNNYLNEHKIQLQIIGRGAGSMKEADAKNLVSVMTYHSVKGLDFEAVFLPKLTRSTTFWRTPDIAKRMFFVALTRSRRNLFLSYYHNPHEFIERIPKDLLSFKEFSEDEKSGEITLSSDVIDF